MVSVVEGKEQRGLLHGGVRFASERIYPNRGPKIFPSLTSLRWTNTTLFFCILSKYKHAGGRKGGRDGGRVSLDLLPSEKRTRRVVRTSPRGREGRWGIVEIPSNFAEAVVILGQLSTCPGPEPDPEF